MRYIRKYRVDEKCRVILPAGSKVLSVAIDNDEPCVFALAEDDAKPEYRTVSFFYEDEPIGLNEILSQEFINQVTWCGHTFFVFVEKA